MTKHPYPKALALLVLAAVLVAGCGPKMKGEVREDVTLTEQTRELEEIGEKYRGPEYTVAVLEFKNKTPGKVLGVGEAATDIMRTMVKKAGLEPIVLTEQELKEQERLMELEQTGALRRGIKDPARGFIPVDFRITGSVTSYGEVEESTDVLLSKTKTMIARVNVDYALVDVESGKTLVSGSGLGEYSKKTGGFLGLGSKSTADPALRDGALRDALARAMTEIVQELNELPFKSHVLAVEDGIVVIRAGTRSRMEPGTVLGVYKPGQNLVDPETGRVIGRRERFIGEVVITRHQSDIVSEARIRSGEGFEKGDVVRPVE